MCKRLYGCCGRIGLGCLAGLWLAACVSLPRPRSGEQGYRLDLGMHRQAGPNGQSACRALGDAGEQRGTAGIEPEKMKWLASILCGVLCALAGAHLSLGYLNGTFAENMSNSRGYIAFACVISFMGKIGRAHV